jgi:hypothetical protein
MPLNAHAHTHACSFIGVSSITLFTRDGPDSSIARVSNEDSTLLTFLSWARLPASVGSSTDAGATAYVRAHCLQQYRGRYAFVTYLGTLDYLMVRGAERGVRGGLETVLKQRDLRYAPGAPLSWETALNMMRLLWPSGTALMHTWCLIDFAASLSRSPVLPMPCLLMPRSEMRNAAAGIVLPVFLFPPEHASGHELGPRYPLRHHKHCEFMGPNAPARMLANSFWSDGPSGDFSFNFTDSLLPITDSGLPWVPMLESMTLPGVTDPLVWGSGGPAHDEALRRFHLTRPFGNILAVFVYLPEEVSAPGLRSVVRSLWRGRVEEACGEGVQAADACCSWEVGKHTERDTGRGGS